MLQLPYVYPLIAVVLGGAIFLHHVHRAVQNVPAEAAAMSNTRFTDDDILSTAQTLKDKPIDVQSYLGSRTGRRYIVVGGSGFVGGWIVLHLLARGENPRRIRILDLRAPSRPDVVAALTKGVEFIQANITDAASVHAAFNASWPDGNEALEHGLTVFHSASLIRYIERVKFLLPKVANVNVQGTQIVVDAARRAGATAFVYTSSGSVNIKMVRWFSLWRSWPENFVQVLNDSTPAADRHYSDFFSNYAVTKAEAERVVAKANNPNGLRTVSVRPSNAVYGSGGDTLVDAYMHRGMNPSWTSKIIQNVVYVENCSIGHLCAEAALLSPNSRADGRAYYLTDQNGPNRSIAYGDLYRSLNVLTAGRCSFPPLHAGLVFTMAHFIEAYHLLRARLPVLPQLPGDILLLQPATFMLVTAHVWFDDSAARQSVHEGGIGYRTPYTSLQGIIWTALQHEKERSLGGVTRPSINYGLGDGPTNVAVAPLRADSTTKIAAAAGVVAR
ncbi:NAD(P)-binding protein [Auriculariales sp. MPI-PUGE-AT-0066]|nr:NAD(P)-binding protein [Auriculariales sp. MPI-PUGE-AT-0066]